MLAKAKQMRPAPPDFEMVRAGGPDPAEGGGGGVVRRLDGRSYGVLDGLFVARNAAR